MDCILLMKEHRLYNFTLPLSRKGKLQWQEGGQWFLKVNEGRNGETKDFQGWNILYFECRCSYIHDHIQLAQNVLNRTVKLAFHFIKIVCSQS